MPSARCLFRRPVQPLQAVHITRGPPPAKDPAAMLLERTLEMALKARMRHAGSVVVQADVSGLALLGGRFGGLSISGTQWRTPLELTAQQIQVSVGEVVIDYPRLAMGMMALQNTPSGATTITLSDQDLGNFLVHPLLRSATQRVVQGRPFLFHKAPVTLEACADGAAGRVVCCGTSAADGQAYKVTLTLPLVTQQSHHPHQPHHPAWSSHGHAPVQVVAEPMQGKAGSSGGAAHVSAGLQHFFTQLLLDLQGIELRQPSLTMRRSEPAHLHGRTPPRHAAWQPPGAAPVSQAMWLLDITMQMRMRSIPPLNMSF